VQEVLTKGVKQEDGLLYVFNCIYIPKKIRKEFVRQYYKALAHGY
jgi:hypothetical protein